MKLKLAAIMSVIIVLCFIIAGCSSQTAGSAQENNTAQTENVQENSTAQMENVQEVSTVQMKGEVYVDGTFEGKSSLTSENYFGKAKVTIKEGKISAVDFEIYDRNTHDSKNATSDGLILDESYSKTIFKGIPEYQKQTTNELKGMELYKSELIKEQDVGTVDAVSGATWSYNIFVETMDNTLKQAEKK